MTNRQIAVNKHDWYYSLGSAFENDASQIWVGRDGAELDAALIVMGIPYIPPSGATLSSAHLFMYIEGFPDSLEYTLSIYKNTEAWTDETWPAPAFGAAPILSIVYTPTTVGYVDFDITTVIQDLMDDVNVYGLTISCSTEMGIWKFGSKYETTPPVHFPYITYAFTGTKVVELYSSLVDGQEFAPFTRYSMAITGTWKAVSGNCGAGEYLELQEKVAGVWSDVAYLATGFSEGGFGNVAENCALTATTVRIQWRNASDTVLCTSNEIDIIDFVDDPVIDPPPIITDPDIPPIVDVGSTITLDLTDLGDSTLADLSEGDTIVGVEYVTTGTDLDTVVLYLYVNADLVQTWTDSSGVIGTASHYFSVAALSAGDCITVYGLATDLTLLQVSDSIVAGVAATGGSGGTYINRSWTIGDTVGEFDIWDFSSTELSTHDVVLDFTGGSKVTSGTIVLTHDSGYDSTVWDLMTFSASVPTGTTLTATVKTAATEEGLLTATSYPTTGSISSSGYKLADNDVPAGRWIEITFTLATTNVSLTPSLYSCEVFYEVEENTTSSKVWTTTEELSDYHAESNVNVSDGGVTLEGTSATTYNSPGVIVVRLDAGVFANWGVISWVDVVPGGTTVVVRTRSFFDPADADDATWLTVTASGDAIVSADNKYLDIEITFTGTSATPTMDSITVEYTKDVNPGISYVFTTKFTLPSKLSTLLLTDVQYEQDTSCFVAYRYTTDGGTTWKNMKVIKKDKIEQVYSTDYLSGVEMVIAAELTSYSTTTKARLDELALLFSTIDGESVQIL